MQTIEKVLSANDTGETGGHQAGILVPKDSRILGFFPFLDPSLKNPRAVVDVRDDTGREWAFKFIYYNNRFFGGTRNEYRLTGMTLFFREFNLRAGDTLIFCKVSDRYLGLSYRRTGHRAGVLRLSETWKVVEAKG